MHKTSKFRISMYSLVKFSVGSCSSRDIPVDGDAARWDFNLEFYWDLMELSGSLLSYFSFPFLFFLLFLTPLSRSFSLFLFLFILPRRGAAYACEFMVYADDLPLAAVRIRPRVIHGRNYRPITQVILRAAIQFNFSICDRKGVAKEDCTYIKYTQWGSCFILTTNIKNIIKNIYLCQALSFKIISNS